MTALHFSTLFLSFLNQALLALFITVYLGQRYLGSKQQKPSKKGLLLFIFSLLLTVFSFALFLNQSFLAPAGFPAIYLQTISLVILFINLILFGYYFLVRRASNKDDHIAGEQNSLISTLETRINERTVELIAANQKLSRLSIAIEQSPSSFVITDLDANIEYVNPAFTRITGYGFEEVQGKNPRILKSNLIPQETYQKMWSTLLAGKTWRGELANRKKNGEIHWEYTTIAPIFDAQGKITNYVADKEDITSRKQTEQLLRESEKEYRDLFEMESDAIFIIRNADNAILEANSAATALYGFSHDELIHKKNTNLSAEPEKTIKATKSPAPSDQTVSIPLRWHRKKNGDVFPVEITARFISWKGQDVHIAAMRDVTERYNIEKKLEQLAITDSLTGLFNRRHFFLESEKIYIRSRYQSCDLTVLMIDIDHFKAVNDTFGHFAGDIVLQEVIRRLQENLRPTDLFARYGGEEFVLMLPRTPWSEIPSIATRLVESVSEQPVSVSGVGISVTISVGTAHFTESVATLYELVSHADQAMYLAKEAGRNRWVSWETDQIQDV